MQWNQTLWTWYAYVFLWSLPFCWFACSQAGLWASGLQPFCAHTRTDTPSHMLSTHPQTHRIPTPPHRHPHWHRTHTPRPTHTPVPNTYHFLDCFWEHLPHLLCNESNVSFHWLTAHPLGSRALVLVAVELKITNVVQMCWWVHLVWWEEGKIII